MLFKMALISILKEGKMNVALNIKESQLRGVLEVLERIGRSVDVTINIKEEEFKKKSGSLTIELEERKLDVP